MIAPNKVLSLDESALGKVGSILRQGNQPITLLKLYEMVADEFEGIDQFLLCLDTLFVLESIDVDPTGRVVLYAD